MISMKPVIRFLLLISILFSAPTKLIAASLVSITPNNALQHQVVSVEIAGQGTSFTQATQTIFTIWLQRGGTTINGTGLSHSTDTLLSADFDIPCDAPAGLWDVKVYYPLDGTLTLSNGFTINFRIPTLLIYVDNDAPGDPAPYYTGVSDPLEDGSTEHPFDAIQEAIDWACDGETVIVLDGAYTGTGNRDIDFLGKAITVRSTDPTDPSVVESTIIDCEDSYRGFIFQNGEKNDSLLSGLTIINGFSSGNGGGIYCTSAPTISHCVIKNNEANTGGGIHSDGQADGESIALIDSTVTENIAEVGGGICYRYKYNIIPLIKNCVISGNYAYGTSYAYGGGVSLLSSNATIVNSTIVGNIAEKYGGAIDCESSDVTIRNCILWDNTALWGDALYLFDNSSVDITYSDIEGGQVSVHAASGSSVNWGTGIIEDYPNFAVDGYWDWGDWIDGDYHLRSTVGRYDTASQTWVNDVADSPCIDAGGPLDDIGVEPNPNGGIINIGAYGGTAEASKSSAVGVPICINPPVFDTNDDCKIDLIDFVNIATEWLDCGLDIQSACWE